MPPHLRRARPHCRGLLQPITGKSIEAKTSPDPGVVLRSPAAVDTVAGRLRWGHMSSPLANADWTVAMSGLLRP